jgi:cytochrome oxidase Cu insertion factor (SCO1/SenC/PrrC family)
MKLVSIACVACIAAAPCLPLWGGQVQALRDATQFGPAVGGIAAQFSLPDQSGRTCTLESLMGRQGLVLVFFRSADW